MRDMSTSSDIGPNRLWWVNQNQTYREETAGGFMWSPKRKANGARNQFYENMREVEPGDNVFSFYGARIQGVGVATTLAETAPKPDFGPRGQSNDWSSEGWLVGVEYSVFESPFRPKDHIDIIRPLLPVKYSPLQATGDDLQSVYLAEISRELAKALFDLADATPPEPPVATDPEPAPDVVADQEQALADLEGRTDIGEVEQVQLAKARRGQGIFRNNVRMNESRCRVTGVSDPAHLRASHIKPWRVCTDTEKLHGCNGLLLAPHIDHLFDRGWISFTDEGQLLISEEMGPNVLRSWGVPETLNVGAFSDLQSGFLTYHRREIFLDDVE